MVLSVIVTLAVVILLTYMGYHIYCNMYWKNRQLNNFPFIHKGKLFWYSRSCASTMFAFAKNKEGVWHVLADQRGKGTPDFQGMWNAVCGYLDFNESGEECAQRETFEETGVFIPKSSIHFWKVNSEPTQNRQNVSLKYYAILDGICESYTFDTSNSEDGEIEDVKWIPVSDIQNYRWAFGHDAHIQELVDTILD